MEFAGMEELQNETSRVKHASRGNSESVEWSGSCGVDCCASGSGRDEVSTF